jgi:hypothetical protein
MGKSDILATLFIETSLFDPRIGSKATALSREAPGDVRRG